MLVLVLGWRALDSKPWRFIKARFISLYDKSIAHELCEDPRSKESSLKTHYCDLTTAVMCNDAFFAMPELLYLSLAISLPPLESSTFTHANAGA